MSDESDSEEQHYYVGSEEGDDESHDSDSDGANHGLLDLEASEASSEPDSDADRFSDDGNYAEYHFPKFMQLPPEIREMVWAASCPDLGSEPRVFELHLHTIISPPGAVHLPNVVRGIVAGPQLESQTASMRAVLAVHRESRALALKSAPHELSLSNGELVRYHEERDVLFVDMQEDILLRGIALRFQELGIEAQNLAFPASLAMAYTDDVVDLMYLLPQTRRLFILNESDDLSDMGVRFGDYSWANTEMVHRYRLDTEEEGEAGLMYPINRIFSWPDLDNHRQFAEDKVEACDQSFWWKMSITECRDALGDPLERSQELNDEDLPDEEKTEAIDRLQNIEVWPMIRFNFGEGSYLGTLGRNLPEDIIQWEGSYDDTEDEYESEGIDDRPIDDSTSVEDEDELILAQNLAQQIFNPHGTSYSVFDNSSDIDELPAANFSSDDEIEVHDPVTIASDSEDDSGSETRAARPNRRVVDSGSDESATETEQSPGPSKRHPRATLADSEDDDDEGSSGAGPVRGANRRARAIRIDSEDEDGQDEDDVPQPSRAGRRRARAVPIDSDDDDEDNEEEAQQPSKGTKARRRFAQEDSDLEDEDGESDSQGGGAKTKDSGSSGQEGQSSSDDDEDDDPPPPKRMSLAKRLRMESNQARPRRLYDDDDSEAEGVNGDGYGYSDDQEDEVDQSDSGMVMGTAEEYEGEDGESEEGY